MSEDKSQDKLYPKNSEEVKHDGWYKYGVMFLYLEMAIAIGVNIFALVSTLTGN